MCEIERRHDQYRDMVEYRIRFTAGELRGIDLTTSERAFLRRAEAPDASLADRVVAISLLVAAVEREQAERDRPPVTGELVEASSGARFILEAHL